MQVRRLDRNHDMTFGRGLSNIARDDEAVAQRVRTRLYLLFGEWFLNTDAGVPYLQKITAKPADLFYTESVIKKTILDTEGIAAITGFSMDFDRNTRKLSIEAAVTNIYGTTANVVVVKSI